MESLALIITGEVGAFDAEQIQACFDEWRETDDEVLEIADAAGCPCGFRDGAEARERLLLHTLDQRRVFPHMLP